MHADLGGAGQMRLVGTFADLGVPTRFLKQLDRGGVHTPFPIKSAVLPDAYRGLASYGFDIGGYLSQTEVRS